jgi:prepilin-type N-terminal cleavage/methylation domain-containing protein
MKNKKVGGFTLIELLVVCVIVTILALLLIPALHQAKMKERQREVYAQAKKVEHAIVDNGLNAPNTFDLGNGWYYYGKTAMDLDEKFGDNRAFIIHCPPGKTNVTVVAVLPAQILSNLTEPAQFEGGEAIVRAAQELGITNGNFLLLRFSDKSERGSYTYSQ